MNEIGVYKIENKQNGKIYIGSSSSGIKGRWNSHLCKLRKGKHANGHLQSAYNKYGEEALTFSILEIVEIPEQVIIVEQRYIDELTPEYNMCPIAISCKGVKRSEEWCQQMSIVHTGHQVSEETRKKIQNTLMGHSVSISTRQKMKKKMVGNNYMSGQVMSEEVKEKQKKSHLGKKLSEETKLKLSIIQKGNKNALGYKHTDEAKQKMSEAKKGNKLWLGKKHTEETKKKISESMKLKKREGKKMKKFISIVLALALILTMTISMFGCQGEKATVGPIATPAVGANAIKTVSWMMRDIGGLEYTAALKVYEYLGKAGNLTIEVLPVAPDVYLDKLSVLVAGNDLPDIVNIGNQDLFTESFQPDFELAKDIGSKGMLVSMTDNLDKLPHYKSWLDRFPEYTGGIKSSDGEIYFASVVRNYNPTSSLGGVIRSDLADTTTFATFDDLFNTLKKMQDKSSKPIWTNRSGILNLNLLSYSFGTSLTDFPYYDQYEKKFINPVATKNFEDAVLFFKKLVDNGILTPEWSTYAETQWYTDAMDGSTQFWVDNMMNVPTHNTGLAKAGISGQFDAFVPPSYNGKFYGWPGKSRLSTTGSIISAKSESIDNILKMFDWTYDSQMSHDILYWGEPGVTCKQLASGSYGNTAPGVQSTEAFAALITKTYGIGENSNWMKVFTDVEYYNDRMTDGVRKWAPYGKVYGDSVYTYSIPAVALNEADAEKYKELYTPLQTYITENVTNFINGKTPMSDFAAFVQKVEEMGASELTDMYNK